MEKGRIKMKHFKDFMFRTKISLFFLLVLVICIISLGTIFSYWSRQNIKERAIESHFHSIHQINKNINSMQKNLWNASTLFVLNPLKYATAESMQEIINAEENILTIVYFSDQYPDTGRYFLSSFNTGLITYSELKKTDIYRQTIEANGKAISIFLPMNDNPLITGLNTDAIAVMRSIRNITGSFQQEDILMFVIPQNVIGNLCDEDVLEHRQGIAVTDPGFSPLYFKSLQEYDEAALRSDTAVSIDGYNVLKVNNKNLLIFKEDENIFEWKIYMIINEESLYEYGFYEMLVAVIIAMVLVFITVGIIILFISNILTKPIKQLISSMDALGGGNWNRHVGITSKDEIGQLGFHYNRMIDNLQKLVDENYVLVLREREAELNTLQAQINPHFLYNTLNLIYVECYTNGQRNLANLTLSLSNLFRLSLNQGKTWLTVATEREILENYLCLQKARFQERLEYSFDIDENMLEYHIPKLLLQPLVENAIVHGIEKNPQGGLIKINGHFEAEKMVFIVQDNGPGMNEQQLAEVSRKISEEKLSQKSSGYALWNIRERLQLYYQDNFVFTFESKPGQGACVKIGIPVCENRNDITKSKDTTANW